MTCSHADTYTAPELLPPCKICAAIVDLDRQGRALADLLDSGTVPAEVRAEIIGARSAAKWSAAARAIIEALS